MTGLSTASPGADHGRVRALRFCATPHGASALVTHLAPVLPRWLREADRVCLVLLAIMASTALSYVGAAGAAHLGNPSLRGSAGLLAADAVAHAALAVAIAAALAARGTLSADARLALLGTGLGINLVTAAFASDDVVRLLSVLSVPLALTASVSFVRGWRLVALQALAALGVVWVVLRLHVPGLFAAYTLVAAVALVVVPSAVVRDLCDQLDRARLTAERTARTDALTGLLNRHGLAQDAPGVVRDAAAQGAHVAVVLLDLDHFKAVNDTWGHATGDRLLHAVATAVRGAVRQGDLVVRHGGEEVAVVTHVDDDAQLAALGERIRADVAALLVPGSPLVTASVGTASAPPGDAARAVADERGSVDGSRDLVHRLLDRADGALYAAKAAGRDRVVHAATAPAQPSAPPPTSLPRTSAPPASMPHAPAPPAAVTDSRAPHAAGR